jgi:hypothetical protein
VNSSVSGSLPVFAGVHCGVYLLETKKLQGIVEIKNGRPHLNRRHDPEARSVFEQIRPRALAAAAGIGGKMTAHPGGQLDGSAWYALPLGKPRHFPKRCTRLSS